MEAASVEASGGRLTREEAQAFRRRWESVNAAERADLASTPVADKFRQLVALVASGMKLGWAEGATAEEDIIRQRWVRLRREWPPRF